MTENKTNQDLMISKIKSHLEKIVQSASEDLNNGNYEAFNLDLEQLLTIVRNSKAGARTIDIIDCFGEIPISVTIMKNLAENISDLTGDELSDRKSEIKRYLFNIVTEVID